MEAQSYPDILNKAKGRLCIHYPYAGGNLNGDPDGHNCFNDQQGYLELARPKKWQISQQFG